MTRRRASIQVRRFWRVAMDANITGQSAMVAYNMLLAVIPIALLALFIAGQVLSSPSVQRSMLSDLREKPCSRAYQDGASRHAHMILAKRHGLDVRWYSQPQRAAFPLLTGAAVVRGRC